MKFTLEIECDNAAFEDDATVEIARILRQLAESVPNLAGTYGFIPLRDINGNRVGRAALHE